MLKQGRIITIEDAKKRLADIALGSLAIMVLDMEYDHDLPATYGHCPMRHSLLWSRIEDALGEDGMKEALEILKKFKAREDEKPIKTNPQLERRKTGNEIR